MKSMLKYLSWDSDFFGFPIYNLDISNDSILTSLPSEIASIAKTPPAGLIQALCDINAIDNINYLECQGFQFIDMRMSFHSEIKTVCQLDKDGIQVLNAERNDIPSLRALSSTLFTDSRFFHRFFDHQKSADFFSLWTEKAVRGEFDDFCLKADFEGKTTGFITSRIIDKSKARIGLIGVLPEFSKKKIGRHLINELSWLLKTKGITSIEVSTQGKNIIAQNYYMRNGFALTRMQLWFYKLIGNQ